jgi:hypothetical protein
MEEECRRMTDVDADEALGDEDFLAKLKTGDFGSPVGPPTLDDIAAL